MDDKHLDATQLQTFADRMRKQVDDHHDRHVERGTGQSETWISGYRVASATGVRCVCDALDSLIAEGTRDPLPPAKDCTWNVLFSCTNCHRKFSFSYRA